MKKISLILVSIILLTFNPVTGQKSGLLNKVSKSVTGAANNVLGNNAKTEKVQPEPMCASDQAIVAMDLGGNLQLDYKELTISILSDGRILARAHGADEYYVAKDGVTKGPFKAGDPQIADFVKKDDDVQKDADPTIVFKPYVTKSAGKFLINFGGKKYGPYARIDNFITSSSKNKFAAFVTENVMMTEDEGKNMEKAMNNAKNDQERMDLAMQMAQAMQENMGNGGPESIMSKLISSIPDVTYDAMKMPNSTLNNEIKFDDIVLTSYPNKIYDLHGNLLFTVKQSRGEAQKTFLSSDNKKYATYTFGTLSFSDNTQLSDLFNPALVSADGKVWLSYMYYSPKHNAIMRHKVQF
jgi:hypothetical protein